MSQRISPLGQVFSRWSSLLAAARWCSSGIVHMRWLRGDILPYGSQRPFHYYCVGSPYSNRIWGHQSRRAVLPRRCSPSVARCAFYLNLLHHLFQGEVCLQLYGTPYGLFTEGAMAGSWVLLHPSDTLFAERMPAVRENHCLQHKGITKTRRKHGFRVHWVFEKEKQRNSWESISRRKEKQENCR